MKKGVFLLLACVLFDVRSAPTDSEIVWLKDVTASLETKKRTLSDLDLPDELTFYLRHGSHALTLNLKRNSGINPDADVYVVRKLKNGRSLLKKARNLEKEDVAYYQDKNSEAFMTVRCVKRSNGPSERLINGNIRIGDINYDLRPAETDVTSRNVLDAPDLLGTRYVLHVQANIEKDITVIDKDAANVSKKNVEKEFPHLFRRSTHGQEEPRVPIPNSTLSARNVGGLHNRDKKDDVKQVYWIEIAVLIDSSIWDLFLSLVHTNFAEKVQTNVVDEAEVRARRNIRRAYSHIINGMNLLYNGIEDNSIEINLSLREFYLFETEDDFPHDESQIVIKNGKNYIEANDYLRDVKYWDKNEGSTSGINYDHAMLFTRHDLYDNVIRRSGRTGGLSFQAKVCDTGKRTSVIETGDYFKTVFIGAHELGHNLGAGHDGEGNEKHCSAKDLFIMTPSLPIFQPAEPYTRNPWIFSHCSVEAFKKTLKTKNCVTNKGVFFNEIIYQKYVKQLPGEDYTPNDQCQLIKGPTSVFCGDELSETICRFMKCTDPKTGKCHSKRFNSATGTTCGINMWCKEGMCVSKASK